MLDNYGGYRSVINIPLLIEFCLNIDLFMCKLKKMYIPDTYYKFLLLSLTFKSYVPRYIMPLILHIQLIHLPYIPTYN